MQFDACLGREATQQDVLSAFGIYQLLNAAMMGYNICVLAYGPTGTGKTYTMTGADGEQEREEEGVIQQSARYLLESLQERPQDVLNVTYVEVYNEAVYDLLGSHDTKLPVRWSAEKGFYVDGAKTVPCKAMDTIHMVIEHGMKTRRVGCHKWNGRSSRSHTIFTIDLHSTEAGGKLMFVDLAGSERLKDHYQNRQETAKINKSLFCLGKVISALSGSSSLPVGHVAYRDSVLTKLLKDGLSGHALTLMITCCSPCNVHVEETLNTLLYAQKAKGIVDHHHHHPCITEASHRGKELMVLREEVKELRKQNTDLKVQLETGQDFSRPLPPADHLRLTEAIPDLASHRWRCPPPLPSQREEMMNNMGIYIPSMLPDHWTRREMPNDDPSENLFRELEVLKAKMQRLEMQFHERPNGNPLSQLSTSRFGLIHPKRSTDSTDPDRTTFCTTNCTTNDGVIVVNPNIKRLMS